MRVGVLTTGRQDWGILRSTCRALTDDPFFDLHLLVGGMHCSDHFGKTERLITEDGFIIGRRLPWLGDELPSAETQAARALESVAQELAACSVAALLLVGDRFETAAAALAATLARVPIVHLHGGEETEGAFDNALRHAITKLSHLHLTSHADYGRRVCALGEDPTTVHVVGAPGLDNLHRTDLADRAELERHLGLALEAPVVVVTLHPTTLSTDGAREVDALVRAMDEVPATYVVTLPNTDPGHQDVREKLQSAARGSRRVTSEALGERRYWGLLRLSDAMVGNSSSALIEAPALALPAVNIGDRQKGRLRGANVLDVAADAGAITLALRHALSPGLRRSLRGIEAPFGDGKSGARIVEILRGWTPPNPPVKPMLRVL